MAFRVTEARVPRLSESRQLRILEGLAVAGRTAVLAATEAADTLVSAIGSFTDTWNPSDHTFSTLSSGNKLATGNNATVGLARSILSKSSGKFHFEATTTWGNVNSSVGMCTSGISLAADLGGATPNGGFTINRNGNVFYNNANILTIAGWTTGTVVCIEVDRDADLYWISTSPAGNWNNSGTANPATGTGGLSFSTTGDPIFIACTVANTDSVLINPGPTFARAPSSGFSAWG